MPKDEATPPQLGGATAQTGTRRHARHTRTRFVWYHTIEPAETSAEGLSYSVDVSRGGLGLVAKEPIGVGTLVFVLMVFHGEAFNLSAVCRVAHVRGLEDGTTRLGLEYVILPPDSRQFLTDNL